MEQKIGIFDSGIGGLTILKELRNLLPKEHYIYIGDNKHCPYGDKTKSELMEYAAGIIDYFIMQGVTIVIIACNTVSSNIYADLVNKYSSIKIIGVIEATVGEMIKTNFNSLLVIATYMTIQSGAYQRLIQERAKKQIYAIATPDLVPLIESNNHSGIITSLHKYLNKYKDDIDTLVLGCTHYPIIEKEIREIMGSDLNIINSSQAVAKELNLYLKQDAGGKEEGKTLIYTTGDVDCFIESSKSFFNYKDLSVKQVDII